jgi:hypothetical protein
VALQSGIDIGDSLVQGRVEIYSCTHLSVTFALALPRAELLAAAGHAAPACLLPVRGRRYGRDLQTHT